MKKIVKLTESDLVRIVKQVISEQNINEGIKDTMVGKIFTSDYDGGLNKLFLDIKNNFNSDNLIDVGDEMGTIQYIMDNGDILSVRDDTFFAIPGYTIKINDDEIDSSFLLSRKIYNFFKKKRDMKYKEEDLYNVNKEKENKLRKNELDRQKELDKLSRFKSKYK